MNDLQFERILGDSRIILPDIQTGTMDIVITDPPYDFDKETKWFFHREMMRVSKHGLIVFCPPENQWILPADQYLFWEKPMSTKNTSKRYSRFVEMILIYENVDNGMKWRTGRHWSQYTNVFRDLVDDATLHAFRKPPSLIERLILNHTDPGDLILDPFAGSFVVADVAERLGREHISIEIDEELYNKYGDKK